MDIKQYTNDAVELLKQLIKTPSVSREEAQAADVFAISSENGASPSSVLETTS